MRFAYAAFLGTCTDAAPPAYYGPTVSQFGDRWLRWVHTKRDNARLNFGGYYPVRLTKLKPRVPRPVLIFLGNLTRRMRREQGGVHRSGED